jgi:hypothetical protein
MSPHQRIAIDDDLTEFRQIGYFVMAEDIAFTLIHQQN